MKKCPIYAEIASSTGSLWVLRHNIPCKQSQYLNLGSANLDSHPPWPEGENFPSTIVYMPIRVSNNPMIKQMMNSDRLSNVIASAETLPTEWKVNSKILDQIDVFFW